MSTTTLESAPCQVESNGSTQTELWRRYSRSGPGSASENHLVNEYLPLVKTVVGRLAMTLPAHVCTEDLFSAGLVGLLNALSQTLLKITSPGVPDFYQGTELWDDSLVDPDNRRPVDFSTRRACLAALQQRETDDMLPLVQELLAQWCDGRIKLYVTYKALHFRRSHSSLFQDGDYLPIPCIGTKQEHVVAFARCKEQHWTLVVVPRLLTKLSTRRQPPVGRRVWGKNFLLLPPEAPLSWHNVLTGEALTGSATPKGQTFSLSTILQYFPVALLSGTLPQTTDPARLLSAPTERSYVVDSG